MKTISVKEAAEALGVSTRAVQYKLQNGDLKGTRAKNQYGVAEWRVWPTKEISEALSSKQASAENNFSEQISFSPIEESAVEAIEIDYTEREGVASEPSSWRQVEMERLELMAEKLVKPLAERIEAQAVALKEQGTIIEEQKRQLRLLPDLQKQAEEERKAAEIGALENEALKKQVAALEQDRLARQKAELEKASSLESQVSALNAQLQRLQAPWWKKFFGTGSDAKQT